MKSRIERAPAAGLVLALAEACAGAGPAWAGSSGGAAPAAAPAAEPATAPAELAVTAAAETAPMTGDADDAVIWAAPDGSAGRVIATDKQVGLFVYDLTGAEVQRFEDGLLNNVDLRPFGEGWLVAATRRDDDTIALWRIDAAGQLTRAEPFLHPGAPPAVAAEVNDIYGVTMAAMGERVFVIVNYKSGHVVQWEVAEDPAGQIALSLARDFRVATQPEGLASDDRGGILYIGEEDVGIWRVPLDPAAPAVPEVVDRVGGICLPVDDVEGLSVWDGGEGGPRWLVAAAQGVHRFAVYDLTAGDPAPCVLSGRVEAGTVDGVTETDGLDVTSAPLPGFPAGLLVMMDDQNEGFTTNFKLIDWAPVAAALAR